VEDEEKKSLPKPDHRSLQRGIAGFGLHCFPDIAVDEPKKLKLCVPKGREFRRLTYENIESNDPDTTSQVDGDDVCRFRRESISTAQLNEQAYQKGFAEGWEKSMIEGENTWHEQTEKKIKPLLTSLQDMLYQLTSLRKETYLEIEKEVVELALAIAKQVICQEITIDKEIVVCVAREALAKVEDPGKIKIKMSPSDLKFIKETRVQLSNMIENIDHVTFEAAENIQSGGCIIETNLGEIDARIERQLQAVEESFRTVVEKI
jgi:flagellar biosynthesis/type III secretory pathway protein FliH